MKKLKNNFDKDAIRITLAILILIGVISVAVTSAIIHDLGIEEIKSYSGFIFHLSIIIFILFSTMHFLSVNIIESYKDSIWKLKSEVSIKEITKRSLERRINQLNRQLLSREEDIHKIKGKLFTDNQKEDLKLIFKEDYNDLDGSKMIDSLLFMSCDYLNIKK